MRTLIMIIAFVCILVTEPAAQQYYPQQDTTTEKPVQYRRGIELQAGCQSYDEKYAGKNLNEIKRSLFPLESTGVWTELHPKVPRTNYWGVYFVNNDTGIATGEKGAIIKTTNGGSSWYNIETSYNKTIRTIGSYNGEKIIAAGDGGLIIISTDYGETWETIQSGTDKNFWNIQFITEQIGWLVGMGSSAFKTTDGGNTWINQQTPLSGYPYWDVSFLDTSFGYICTNLGGILRTTNGGLSWDVTQVGDNYGLFSIYSITRMKAVALGFAGKHVYTSDGGESWQFITYLGDTFIGIAFLDSLNGFAVGTNCFETTDGGFSWTWRTDMKQAVRDIAFSSENVGYYVGDALVLEKTTSSGQSWYRTIINDNFTDVFFTDENNGWFIGNQRLYHTTDGGITLIQLTDFPGLLPSSVYFFDKFVGVVGAQHKIYKTYDGGLSWQEKNITGISGNAGEFIRLFFINDDIGWAISYGYVIKTSDGGENWFVKLNVNGINGIHFSDSLNGWVTRGGLYKPFKTYDGGENWIEQINLTLNFMWDVFFNDSLDGFISRNNELNNTTDGGITWSVIPGVTVGRFSNKIQGFIFLAGGRTFHSTNAGKNWYEVTDLFNREVNFIRLSNINDGYAVGSRGLIIKYYDENIPIELISFNATIQNENNLILEWSTATETNNRGFEIERLKDSKIEKLQNWKKVGFVSGHGTTTEAQFYSFTDKSLQPGKYEYRLKQVDYDGTYEYSNTISIEVKSPTKFKLNQNYPNPFNPDTKIEFQLPEDSSTRLTVYNVLGERIVELVNEKLNAGYYEFEFHGQQLPSGIYIYTLNTEKYNESRKMILLK